MHTKNVSMNRCDKTFNDSAKVIQVTQVSQVAQVSRMK